MLSAFALASARTADCLFLFDAAQFALGDVPAFAAHRAENPGIGHALAKAAQQLLLTFALLESD